MAGSYRLDDSSHRANSTVDRGERTTGPYDFIRKALSLFVWVGGGNRERNL